MKGVAGLIFKLLNDKFNNKFNNPLKAVPFYYLLFSYYYVVASLWGTGWTLKWGMIFLHGDNA